MSMTWVRQRRLPTQPDCIASTLPDEALEATWQTLQERRFATLQASFARHGGCAPADHVCCLLRAYWDQPVSRVGRWIAHRDIVSITWQTQIWIPMFQFERPSLDIVPSVSELVKGLRSVYDDWELAEWFLRPHELLAGRSPVVLLACDPWSVKEAARMDHFINRL